MRSEIMYVELKGDGPTGTGRIGRVEFSKTGRTLYYRGRTLTRMRDAGGRVNYVDAATGEEFWVSGCKKSGQDTLSPGLVEIDEDVREAYWREIRNQPARAHETTFRSPGNRGKRPPRLG